MSDNNESSLFFPALNILPGNQGFMYIQQQKADFTVALIQQKPS